MALRSSSKKPLEHIPFHKYSSYYVVIRCWIMSFNFFLCYELCNPPSLKF